MEASGHCEVSEVLPGENPTAPGELRPDYPAWGYTRLSRDHGGFQPLRRENVVYITTNPNKCSDMSRWSA